ncbi:MAG: deoxyribodipyrimidine photo-lyase [Candidatus Marinimicrobia bacterium]|nr:deoxyribodipyrimidine photo-lyase [Candidatus Neomarinimicrobiota bacterium]
MNLKTNASEKAKPKTAIFCFRRDLRLDDNLGLQQALENYERVIPAFIFDPRQLKPHDYRSIRALNFMFKALVELRQNLHNLGSELFIRSSLPYNGLLNLADEFSAEAVYLNRDYTPFSIRRDEKILTACEEAGIKLHQFDDALLNPPEVCLKGDGSPYTVFTPFYKNARHFPVMFPGQSPHFDRLIRKTETPIQDDLLGKIAKQFELPELTFTPSDLDEIMASLARQKDYDQERNNLATDSTSHLAVFLKFGVISVRDVYHRIKNEYGADHPLIRQLYWRDFYSHIAYHFPHVFGNSFKPQFAHIQWNENLELFETWSRGETGFPVVDAGMRELNSTGFMHNRARMITASFLVKDLHLDWRWGERYFASQLLDYDPAVNNGNWQWAASTGCDAQPYFRIFNPWLQQKKFDPVCTYIKRWIPELRDLTPAAIHNLAQAPTAGYPEPIVNHSSQATLAKQLFQTASQEYQNNPPTLDKV